MVVETGVLFALIALVCWGFGDFLIQRTTRKIGDWETLFVITFLGALVLTPFIFNDLQALITTTHADFWLLMGASTIFFAAALIPISIALALSEAYIAVAALLGLLINKEKLLTHQKAGLVLTLVGAVALSIMV